MMNQPVNRKLGVFHPIIFTLVCLNVLSNIEPARAMTDLSRSQMNLEIETTAATTTLAQRLDRNIVRTPESIERARYRRGRLVRPVARPLSIAERRERARYRRQLEWRRRYGDLAPRRDRR